jgi:hypothetical protein
MEEIPEYPPATPSTGNEDIPAPTSPTDTLPDADENTGGTTPAPDPVPVKVPVSMPDLTDDLYKFTERSLGSSVNNNYWYTIDGSLPPLSGSTPGPGVLFEDICPDSYSTRQTSYTSAMSMESGTGAFGEAASAHHLGWWSTNFNSGFTEESYGTYSSKRVLRDQGLLVLSGVACHADYNTFGQASEFPAIWVKWGAAEGSIPFAPYMQFLGTNENTANTVFNYSIDVPLANGQVNVDALNILIAQSCPKNGCFFYMDLRVNKVFFQIMDGAKKKATDNPTRDFIPDGNPKYTGQLETVPAFGAYSVSNPYYTGKSITTDDRLIGVDYTTPWLPAFTGYDQASNIGGFTSAKTSVVAAQTDTTVTVGAVYYNNNQFYGGSQQTTFKSASGYRIYSPWLRVGTSTQIVGWLLQVGDNAVLVNSGYGYVSNSPKLLVAGSSEYVLTTTSVMSEILSVMPRPKRAIGFNYDWSVGDYGKVTWLSQI